MPDRSRAQPAKDPETQAILANHRRLRRVLDAMRQADGFVAVCGRLAELRAILAEHFAHEETPDGLFAAIDAQAPRLHPRVARCREEHAGFLAEAEEIAARAERCSDAEQADVQQAALDLVRRLLDHEDRETELLIEAWNDDVGELD